MPNRKHRPAFALLLILPFARADDEFDKLNQQYQTARQTWQEQLRKPQETASSPAAKFLPEIRAYAEKHEGQPAAIPALVWMLTEARWYMPHSNRPAARETADSQKANEWALDRLQINHAAQPEIKPYLPTLRPVAANGQIEPKRLLAFYEKIVQENPDPDAKSGALLNQALTLYGAEVEPPSNANRKRALELLHKIAQDYAGGPVARDAEAFIFEWEKLQAGMKAPDLGGLGADGGEIKLSQFRGQVVALVFWNFEKEKCAAALAGQRALAQKLTGRPFTPLGVNADPEDRTLLQERLKREVIAWPNIRDGTQGPICGQWNVRTFPTIYVIDQEGVIRHRDLRAEDLETAVTELLRNTPARKSDTPDKTLERP